MMTFTDILPRTKWIEFEQELNQEFGINAAVFATDGSRITDFVKWANKLCPVIKGNKQGQAFICSAAHQIMAEQAKKTKEPVIEVCDAGLIKIVLPVFNNGHFLGVVSGCGKKAPDQEIETFLISHVTGVDEEEIKKLSKNISFINENQQKKMIRKIENRLSKIREISFYDA